MRQASRDRADANQNVGELRLGVVCYGGVSLAIYMHGVTKEIEKLVVASRAFEQNPERNPFSSQTVEGAYWEVLRQRHCTDPEGVLTRVVVDVVAGTSAGGINGVILCKALARNRTQEPLRHLWFVKGDIKQLLGGTTWKEFVRVTELVTELPFGKAHAPLDGNAMFGWLVDALDQVDATAPAFSPQGAGGAAPLPSAVSPLVPDGSMLNLFVTTTDYYGYRQSIPIASPPLVTEARNRHILEFDYLYENGKVVKDQFDRAHNVALGFAARCTSSFPGAFPPMSIPNMTADLARLKRPPIDVAAFKQEFFRAYELSDADAAETSFIDGGVLANYPFRPAIEAIVSRRSESQVTRRLIYLQPVPPSEIADPHGQEPSLFGVIWAGLSTIAGSQPILDDMVYVRDFNARVEQTQEIVKRSTGTIAHILESGLDINLGQDLSAVTQDDLRVERQKVEAAARQQAGYAWSSYFQIRVLSIVEQFAVGVCALCDYETANLQNNLQFIVGLIVEEWARRQGYIGDGAEEAKQEELVSRFDVGYLNRRLAFVLDGVDQMYGGKPDAPSRKDLNRAKAALYDAIDDLNGVIEASAVEGDLKTQIQKLFPQKPLLAFLKTPSLTASIQGFVTDSYESLNGLFQQLGNFVSTQTAAVYHQLYLDFGRITAQWSTAYRREVLIRFIGFPFWDTLIYPVTRLSQAGELREIDVVRFSPLDSTALAAVSNSAPPKLQGLADAHFGAFFSQEARENDYLWGRLDAAERLISVLLDRKPTQSEVKPALAAILAEEVSGPEPLTLVNPLIARIKAALAAIPDPPPAPCPPSGTS